MSIIESVVNKIPDWDGKDVIVTPLSGGLTNSNFKVTVYGVPYFVRVPGASTLWRGVKARQSSSMPGQAFEILA